MAHGITTSAVVLEEARVASAMEKLLLDKSLLQCEDLSSQIHSLLQEDRFAELAGEFPLVVVEQDPWQVIAAQEETAAEAGFQQGVPDAADAGPLPLVPDGDYLPDLTRPSPVSDATQSAFSREEAARLRVQIFAASTPAEKVAALRQFAYAPVSSPEKVRIFLQATADEDRPLRAAAPQGLRLMGLSPDMAEAARLLAEGTPEEARAALARLRDLAPAAPELDRDAALMALLGILRDPHTPGEDAVAALNTLRETATAFGADRLCRDDILRILLERLLSGSEDVLLALRGTCAAIESLRRGAVSERVLAELHKSRSPAYRGALLQLLTGMDLPMDARGETLRMAADTLLHLPTDSSACRMVAGHLVRAGDEGLRLLAQRLPAADTAHQRHFIRELDRALRSQDLRPDTREEIVGAGLALLRHSPRQVRTDLLETQLCSRDDVSPSVRREIAAALAADLRDYNRSPLSETLENSLVCQGPPAIAPLLTVLREHRGSQDATILANALGRIGSALAATGQSEAVRQTEDVLRELQKLTFSDTVVRDSLHLAMGQICSQPAIPQEVGNLILRTLLSRLEGNARDAATLEALGLVCNGAGGDHESMNAVAQLALNHLMAVQPDPTLEVGRKQGEEFFTLGGPIDVYAALIPACLATLGHLAVGPRTPASLRTKLVDTLLERWEKAMQFEVQWSPVNVTQLTEILGAIGASDMATSEQRLRIANTLARHVDEIPVLHALASLLRRGDPEPSLDRLAGSLVLRLLKRLQEDEVLTSEDRETYLRILAKVGLRGRFQIRGGDEARLVERMIEALVSGLRQGIPGSAQHLTNLRDAGVLAPRHQALVADELRRFTSVIPVDRPADGPGS